MDNLLTSREVQDLLKIDRTTVYRMLKDGRLSAVKVGQQWRFPRSDIEDLLNSELASRTDAPPPPLHALPLHCVQAIQEVVADMAGVGIFTTAPNGTPLTETSNPCAFCTLVQSSPSGQAACRAEWAMLAHATGVRPQAAVCHAGLSYLHARIDLNDEPAAMLVAGQFRHPHDTLDSARLAQRYGLDLQQLDAAMTAIPIQDQARVVQLGGWLTKVARTFTTIAAERATMLDRLRHIAALSTFDAGPSA